MTPRSMHFLNKFLGQHLYWNTLWALIYHQIWDPWSWREELAAILSYSRSLWMCLMIDFARGLLEVGVSWRDEQLKLWLSQLVSYWSRHVAFCQGCTKHLLKCRFDCYGKVDGKCGPAVDSQVGGHSQLFFFVGEVREQQPRTHQSSECGGGEAQAWLQCCCLFGCWQRSFLLII